MHKKLFPDLFIILVNNLKQPLQTRIYFKSKNSKEDYQKALKKVTFFLLSSPVPFNRQNYQKQKEPATSD